MRYAMMIYNSPEFQEWKQNKRTMEVYEMKEVLVVIGQESIEGLGMLERTIPFKDLVPQQIKDYRYNDRLLYDKHGELIKRITGEDLRKIDTDYEKKYGDKPHEEGQK